MKTVEQQQLGDQSIVRKSVTITILIIDLIVLGIFQAKLPNFDWVHFFKCDDLLFFVLYDSKLNIFGFWTDNRIHHLGLWEIIPTTFPYFSTFYKLK